MKVGALSRHTRNKRTVVHVSSAHPWTDNRIHYRECATLRDAGYEVTLIAVESPSDAPKQVAQLLRIPARSRLKRFLVSAPQALWLAARTRARIVHLHDPELAWGIPILRLMRRDVIFDAHEDLPVDVLNKPYIPVWALPLLKAFAACVVWLGGRSNRVIAATEAIAERFPVDKTSIVHNYPPLRSAERAVSADDREDVAVYIGAMSAIRGTAELLDAARDSAFPDGWRLVIAGTATPEVARRVETAGDEIENQGQLLPEQARQLLLSAKVGIVPFHATPAHLEALPTKMFEYFAAGLPVIASDFPLWRSIVGTHDCGLLVDASSPAAIAKAVREYARDPELLRRHSENARRLAVEELNWEPEGEALIRVYETLGS